MHSYISMPVNSKLLSLADTVIGGQRKKATCTTLTDSALAQKKLLAFHFLLVFSPPRQSEPRTEPTQLAISTAVGDTLIRNAR